MSIHVIDIRNLDLYVMNASVDLYNQLIDDICKLDPNVQCYPDSAIDNTPVFTFFESSVDYYEMLKQLSLKYPDSVFYIRGDGAEELIDEIWFGGEYKEINLLDILLTS